MSDPNGTLDASNTDPAGKAARGEAKDSSVYVSETTRNLAQTLAQFYGTTQAQTVRAALQLLDERRQEIDAIQVPELVAEIADLEIAVRGLIGQGEHLEKLLVEAVQSHSVAPPRSE